MNKNARYLSLKVRKKIYAWLFFTVVAIEIKIIASIEKNVRDGFKKK